MHVLLATPTMARRAGRARPASSPRPQPVLAPWVLALALGTWATGSRAEDPNEISLTDLTRIEVTTVSRKPAELWESPAAIYVITHEDIRTSPCSNIPELLRTVPGLDVARVDDGTWAISARGFNGRFANKMLVLVDGRSVYTSLFSGVHWELVRMNLADIERIEIIRGPGATMWGANAVNGIINIITRSAESTSGGQMGVAAGSRETVLGTSQFAGGLGSTGFMRVSGEVAQRENPGLGVRNLTAIGQGAIRIDLLPSPATSLTFRGGVNDGTFARTYYLFETPADFTRRSVYGAARESDLHAGLALTHVASTDAELALEVTADRVLLDDVVLNAEMRTYVAEVRQRWRASTRHEFIAGAGLKINDDEFASTFSVRIDPAHQTTHFANLFVQDEFSILPRRLIATLGTKYEHNAYTGGELQPSARLAWLASANAMGWLSVSRAVRTPSRIENGGRAIIAGLPPGALGPGTPAAFMTPVGNPNFGSEVVVAYEAGSRWIAHPRLSLDVAAYYNRYDNLRTVTQGAPSLEIAGGVPYLAVPLAFGNEGSGESRGFEVVADWRLHPRAKLEAGYSFERLEIFSVNDQLGHEGLMWQGTTPQSIAFLKSSTDLVGPARLDANLRYVGRLEHLVVQSGPPTGEIPAYLALDLRLGIDVSRTLHAFAGGRNLLAGRHGEFMDEVLSPPNAFQVGEEYYAGLRIRL